MGTLHANDAAPMFENTHDESESPFRTADEDRERLVRALDGDRTATRALVERLSPVIGARVRRVTELVAGRTPDQVRQLREDLTQEVFVALFQDDGRALRSWAPERGLSLEGYVGLVARNHAASILRSGRRSAWREDATEDEALVNAAGATVRETGRFNARDTLTRLLPRLRAELSDRGFEILELLMLEGRSIDEVCTLTGLSSDSLYTWRSRIAKLATHLAAELDRDPTGRELLRE